MTKLLFILGSHNDQSGMLSDISLCRVQKAIEVQKQILGSFIVAIGGYGRHFNTTNKPHKDYLNICLRERGASFIDSHPCELLSCNTVEDIQLVSEFARSRSCHEYYVVTSEFHVDRCKYIIDCIAPGDNVDIVSAGTPPNINVDLLEHEQLAIARLRAQGGVILNGVLHPHKRTI